MDVSKEIYRPHGRGLGDCFSDLNWLVHLSRKKDEILQMSIFYEKGDRRKYVRKLEEMVPLLEEDYRIKLCDKTPTEPKKHWTWGGDKPMISTKVKWKPNDSGVICYQFDGQSHKQKNFPSKEKEDEVLNHMQSLGYKTIRLGGHQSLQECVDLCAEAEAFVGVDSGMAYLASCTGCPLFHVKNGMDIEFWHNVHANKHYLLSMDAEEFMDNFSKFNEDKSFYKENASNSHLF